MRSDYKYLRKLLDHLIELNNKLEAASLSENESKDFGCLNDYFLYLTLDALQYKQKGFRLFETFSKLEKYCEDKKNNFYVGVFFALSELLTLKYKIRARALEILENEDFLSKEAWQKKYKETKRRLGF